MQASAAKASRSTGSRWTRAPSYSLPTTPTSDACEEPSLLLVRSQLKCGHLRGARWVTTKSGGSLGGIVRQVLHGVAAHETAWSMNDKCQRSLIEQALSKADEVKLRHVLEGTIGDTQSFCWATLRQFERRAEGGTLSTPREFGLQHAEKHLLLVVAHDTVAHVEAVEMLLERIGTPRKLPPVQQIRDQLREARNLLAAHRDERVLYWRLTGKHTPRVEKAYKRLRIHLPAGSIDTEIIAYYPPPDATEQEVADGYNSVGTVGGLLRLQELGAAFAQLESALAELADH